MHVRVFDTYDEMSEAAAQLVADQVKSKPDSLLCLASGDTPTGTLRRLVAMAQAGKIDFSRCRFVGLDEWVGMDRFDNGSCQQYVYKEFFDPLNISADRITFFDAKANDLRGECDKVDAVLAKEGPLDLTLVGVGVNGHIGLNEPGISPDLKCHVSNLAETTKTTAEKYFAGEKKTLDKGITLGLRHILNSRKLVVIANGPRKADIMKAIIHGPVTTQVPGSVLQRHENCHVLLDKLAAASL